ncbi:hypothetical protein D3C75_647160 [compost metagenome]
MPEQLLGHACAVTLTGKRGHHPLAFRLNAMLEQFAAVAANTLRAADGIFTPTNKRNMTMPQTQQMLCCQLGAKEVIGADKIEVHVVHRAHHHNRRNVAPLQRFKKQRRRFSCRAQHHAAGVIAHQRIDKLLLPLAGFFAVCQKKQQIVALHLLTQTGGHFTVKRVGDVMEQQPNLIAGAVAQIGRRLVIHITQIIQRFEHALASGVRNTAPISQHH